jgi:anti-sigma factor RsiW
VSSTNPDDTRAQAEDDLVEELLRTRLPRYSAPDALKAELVTQFSQAAESRLPRAPRRSRKWLALGPALGIALAAGALLFVRSRGLGSAGPEGGPLVTEAVNDHLRLLYAERPVEIESGGIHQVKPWFTGRLDFAPSVAFDGNDEFSLQGGAVAYFIDRKAAMFLFKRRLHTISVFVFRADGLPWRTPTTPMGNRRAEVTSRRGFHVVLFREDELGYALVSDVAPAELLRLGAEIAGTPAP